MTPCNRPGCGGTVEETGFCDTCDRRPLSGEAAVDPGSSRQGAGDALSLPVFEFPDPSSRIRTDAEVSESSRVCGRCGAPIGRSYKGSPGLAEGVCRRCGHPYSFLPTLHEGTVVADQYEVLGCFARGGLGWVYLARDTHLDGNLVVLKGLIDARDTRLAVAERRALTTMDHKNIVRIFNFVSHRDARTGESRDYIVMEYVDGLELSEVQKRSALGREPLRVEHILTCVRYVLEAFEYLHGRGFLYCDMKPANVIVRPGNRGEHESRVKLIDLGAVRRIGDHVSPKIGTEGYEAPEADTARGLTVRSDLHTVGVMLDRLFHASVDWGEVYRPANDPSPLAIGLESFERLWKRAAHTNPDRRFGSAREMLDQLDGVLREFASLRDGVARPEPSTTFTPTAALLDDGLGSVPPLARWTRPEEYRGTGESLPDGRPTPGAVAVGLPVPRVDPDDAAADVVTAAGASEPRRLLDKLSTAGLDTPEVLFARCRAHLELAELDHAADDLRAAGDLVTDDWRIAWHRGLLALARGDVGAARSEFDAVYDALPGEDAPKLALGFCAEHGGDPFRAERLYEAVWRRDRSQGSAVFGLARIRLARRDRAGAVALLDEVPKVSRHYDAAAVAAVVVLSGRLGSADEGERGEPDPADLRKAAERLSGLYLDGGAPTGPARDRMTAILREAAFESVDNPVVLPAGALFGDGPGKKPGKKEPSEKQLSGKLAQSYRALAGQADDADDLGLLIDLANKTRPRTWV
ncbi:serine/threonine-protein kinase [Saccharothrix deserti]|uniref:serine/threonine-protein kinase n=1 Tax=Saccharothrix deserti TaxID=2593674 RepID=UPI00131CAF6C|nr:serine/threonine-protein kinase [Saccharothrix deserti]